MNAPIDILAFTAKFEGVGFDHHQARALASAFSEAGDIIRGDLLTKMDLELRMAEFEARLNRQMGDMEVRLTKQIGDVGKETSGRLWSTITIIAGVSTAISAAIGAAVTLLLKAGGL